MGQLAEASSQTRWKRYRERKINETHALQISLDEANRVVQELRMQLHIMCAENQLLRQLVPVPLNFTNSQQSAATPEENTYESWIVDDTSSLQDVLETTRVHLAPESHSPI